jgi:hypothetical protein
MQLKHKKMYKVINEITAVAEAAASGPSHPERIFFMTFHYLSVRRLQRNEFYISEKELEKNSKSSEARHQHNQNL